MHQSNFFVYWKLLLATMYQDSSLLKMSMALLDGISEKWITGLSWSDVPKFKSDYKMP